MKRCPVIPNGEGEAAGGTNQNLKQVRGNHVENCTRSILRLLAVE